jgi:hypothetical protein
MEVKLESTWLRRDETMRMGVMAAGAVGSYFGGQMAAAGHDVAFIARDAHLEAIRRDGLKIESALGDLHLKHVHATDEPRKVGSRALTSVDSTAKVDAAACTGRAKAWVLGALVGRRLHWRCNLWGQAETFQESSQEQRDHCRLPGPSASDRTYPSARERPSSPGKN